MGGCPNLPKLLGQPHHPAPETWRVALRRMTALVSVSDIPDADVASLAIRRVTLVVTVLRHRVLRFIRCGLVTACHAEAEVGVLAQFPPLEKHCTPKLTLNASAYSEWDRR
jgi:hypothetical protein